MKNELSFSAISKTRHTSHLSADRRLLEKEKKSFLQANSFAKKTLSYLTNSDFNLH